VPLGHKLVDVVVVAVVYAVDVSKPTVAAHPLTITYAFLGEGRHPADGQRPLARQGGRMALPRTRVNTG
jgi:hypothetical protein